MGFNGNKPRTACSCGNFQPTTTISCNPGDGIIIWGFGTGRQEHILAHGKAEGEIGVCFAFIDQHYFDGRSRISFDVTAILVCTKVSPAPLSIASFSRPKNAYDMVNI